MSTWLSGGCDPGSISGGRGGMPRGLEDIPPSVSKLGDAYDHALMELSAGLCEAEYDRTTVSQYGSLQTIADVECAGRRLVDLGTAPKAPLDPGKHPAGRVRVSPHRCPQPKAVLDHMLLLSSTVRGAFGSAGSQDQQSSEGLGRRSLASAMRARACHA